MSIRVLFVCHGNICRSPMAEFILKDMVKKLNIEDKFIIKSAATSTEEIYNGIGNPVYPPAREELKKHGISCEGKRAVQIKKEDYDNYDYLICMDSANVRNTQKITKSNGDKIKMILEFAGINRSVIDPWYSNKFDDTYNDLVIGCKAFLQYLKDSRKINI